MNFNIGFIGFSRKKFLWYYKNDLFKINGKELRQLIIHFLGFRLFYWNA